MALTQKDLEQIERVIYKNGDDVAMANSRAFERLEERLAEMESHLYRLIDESATNMNVAQRGTEEKFVAFGKEVTGQISAVNKTLADSLKS